jgi:inner membrane protein
MKPVHSHENQQESFMKRPLLYKFLATGGLILVLLIPLAMIGNSIDERRNYSLTVIDDIARSSSYSQTLVGPVLVIPYEKTERVWRLNEKGEQYQQKTEITGALYFLPERYHLNGDLTMELRKRGIYTARLYHADTEMTGQFVVPLDYGIDGDIEDYQFGTAYVAMGISDIRGIKNSLTLTLNKQTFDFEPGSELKTLGSGVHAKIATLARDQVNHLNFSVQLMLQGTEQFNIAPIGKETHVELHSDWPHPSFIGEFLPVERNISDAGFSARWQTSYFSTNFGGYFLTCVRNSQCNSFTQAHFGVSLIDPVNQYVKSDRAIKYALLFIVLTFAGFFLFEVLKRLAIHPIQYGLVGLALALFYLLLLSLSEHIGFGLAYLLSSLACILLIGFYVCHVLQSFQRGLGFTLGLSLLYALLYGLLSAEDYALLMGAILLFALLGTFMMLTRKLDWYALGQSSMSERHLAKDEPGKNQSVNP